MASASSSSSAIAPCPASRDINRERVAITFNPSAGLSAPATTAAVTSPIECPITASGSTPYERHNAVNANCIPTKTGWMRSIPRTSSPDANTSRSENPTCSRKTGSSSATAAANAGSVASNS